MNLSLTVVANITSNYGEGFGNISTVQKVFRGGKAYAIRSRESLKNAIMVQSGLYDDLKCINFKGVNQKEVTKKVNISNCRALEGGYMNTSGEITKRNSSFYITDAVSCEPFILESRFHNNLYLAQTYAKENNLNVQSKAGECGLMIYQYEYDKDLKVYSITIDLEVIGKDVNFEYIEVDKQEKFERIECILDAIESLSLLVRGSLDNAEPLFIVGGLVKQKSHIFENVVKVKKDRLVLSDDLKNKLKSNDCKAGLLNNSVFDNEDNIIKELDATSMSEFFDFLKNKVKEYYEV